MADELPDIELSDSLYPAAPHDPFALDLELSPDVPEEPEDKGFFTEAGEFLGSMAEGAANEVLAVGAPEAVGRGELGLDVTDSTDYGDAIGNAIGQYGAQAGIIMASTKAGALAGTAMFPGAGTLAGAAGGLVLGSLATAATFFQGFQRAQYGTRQGAQNALKQQAAERGEAPPTPAEISAVEETAADNAFWTNLGGEAIDTAFAVVTGGTGGGVRAAVASGLATGKAVVKTTTKEGFKKGFGTGLSAINSHAIKRAQIQAGLSRAGRFKQAGKEYIMGALGEGSAEAVQGTGERAAIRNAVRGDSFMQAFGEEFLTEETLKDFGIGAIAQGVVRGGAVLGEQARASKLAYDQNLIMQQAAADGVEADLANSSDLSKAKPLQQEDTDAAIEGAKTYERVSEGRPTEADKRAATLNKIYHDLGEDTDVAILPPDFAPTQVVAAAFANDPDIAVRPLEDGSTEISLVPGAESQIVYNLRRQVEQRNFLKKQLPEVQKEIKIKEKTQDRLINRRNQIAALNDKLDTQIADIDALLAEDRRLRSADQPEATDSAQPELIANERLKEQRKKFRERRKAEKAAIAERAERTKKAPKQEPLIPSEEIAGRDVSDISDLEGFLSKDEKKALREERQTLQDEVANNTKTLQDIEGRIELLTSPNNDGALDRLRLQEQRTAQELENMDARLYQRPADQMEDARPTPLEALFNYKDRKKDALKYFKYSGPEIKRERGFNLQKITEQPVPDRFRADIRKIEAAQAGEAFLKDSTNLNTTDATFLASLAKGVAGDIKTARNAINKDRVVMAARRKGTVERGLGYTPEQGRALVDSKLAGDNYQAALASRVSGSLRRLKDLVDAVPDLDFNAKVLNEALTGDIVSLSKLPPDVRGEVDSMRVELDNLSDRLIQEGVIDSRLRAIVAKNKGVYLNRSYRIFEDSVKHIDEVTKNAPVWNRAKALFEQQFEQRENESDSAYDSRIHKEMRDFLIELGGHESFASAITANVKSGKPSTALAILKHRSDIPLEIRELMGENTDLATNYSNSMRKMGALLAGHRHMSDVRDVGMAAGFITTEPGEFTTVQLASEGSNVMSPLNGLWVEPWFKESFEEAFKPAQMSGFWKMLVGSEAAVRYGKTVLSPQTHARNFWGNTYFLAANGNLKMLVPNLGEGDTRGIKEAVQAIRADFGDVADANLSQLLSRYIELGVFQGFDIREFELLLKDLKDSDGTFESFRALREARYSPVRLGEKALETATKLYSAEDTFFKVLTFEAERAKLARRESNKNKTAEQLDLEAARITRDVMPTYELIPEGVQAIRRNPVFGPFVSFHAEAIRNTVNTSKLAMREIKEGRRLGDANMVKDGGMRIAGLLAASLAPTGLSMAMNMWSGTTDEEEKALRVLSPWWDKFGSLAILYRDDEGNPFYTNVSALSPHQVFIDPMITLALAARDENFDIDEAIGASMLQFAEPFIAPGFLTTAGAEIGLEAIGKGANKIFKKHDPLPKKVALAAEHMWDTVHPGLWRTMERLEEAATGATTKSGLQRNLFHELLAIPFGIRITAKDLKSDAGFVGRDYKNGKQDATTVFSSLAKSKATIYEPQIKEAFDRMVEIRKAVDAAALIEVQALAKLGLTQDEIYNRLTDKYTVSQDDAFLLVNGQQPPLKMSDKFIDDVLEIPGRAEQLEQALGRPIDSDFSDLIALE